MKKKTNKKKEKELTKLLLLEHVLTFSLVWPKTEKKTSGVFVALLSCDT